MQKPKRFALCFAILTAAFTVYLLLDTFVIERDYSLSNASPAATAVSDSETTAARASTLSSTLSAPETVLALPADAEKIGSAVTDSYEIDLYTFRVNNTQIYAADLKLSSVQELKTAFAEGRAGRNITDTTSAIAAQSGAVLAINGDFYGAREKGIVIRNGVLYRDSASDEEILVIYADGSFEILSGTEKSGEELLADGARQAFSFGPGLVEDGAVSVSAADEVGRAKSSNPRTAVGTLGEGHYLFLVSDGRTEESEGLSLYELSSLLREMGCVQAYNLDGGGSSTMVFRGMLVNRPTTNGKRITERSVSDIVYIG